MKSTPESRTLPCSFTRHNCQHLWLVPRLPGDSQPAALVALPDHPSVLGDDPPSGSLANPSKVGGHCC